MAPAAATKRLRRELIKLQTDPPPGVVAEPDEANVLKWSYALRGPPGTPFDGGVYVGRLVFPPDYPMAGPSISMLTPSGRFVPGAKICLSMSDFHPESWNPVWSVATILQGVQSFMAGDEDTTGSLTDVPPEEQARLAGLSAAYNGRTFPALFGGDAGAALDAADGVRLRADQEAAAATAATASHPPTPSGAPSPANGGTAFRRGRRLAAANANPAPADRDATAAVTAAAEKEGEGNEDEGTATKAPPKELSAEEIEKRRKKNAKKRSKQKAKKPKDVTHLPTPEPENGTEAAPESLCLHPKD